MTSPYNPNRDRDTRHANALLLLASAMGGGDPTTFIQEQEAAGQRQIVNSDVLPAVMRGDRAEFEAVGFTFGEPVTGDDMFIHATLPEGWKRQGSDHDMWSYIVDPQGRRRVSIFYKAAFYDRSAHMGLISVGAYAHECLNLYGDGAPTMPVLDDQWATREAVAGALEEYAVQESEGAARIEASLADREPRNAEECRKIADRQRDYAARARAFAAQITAEGATA